MVADVLEDHPALHLMGVSTYGIVLTIARTLGETVPSTTASSSFPGTSETLTLLVDRHSRGDEYGAYAVSTLLMTVAGAGVCHSGDPRRPACPGGKIGFEKETFMTSHER